MCYLISKEGGVKMLFDICRTVDLQQAHGAALRAIATICCVPESIAELEKVSGHSNVTLKYILFHGRV